MTEAPDTSPEPKTSDRSPPNVVVQQASESDDRNEAMQDAQNNTPENGGSQDTAHEEFSDVKSVDSQSKVDGETGVGLESVEESQEKSSGTEIAGIDVKEAQITDNTADDDDENVPHDVVVASASENAIDDSAPTEEKTGMSTGDNTIELSRSKTPDIIITPTDDDKSATDITLQEMQGEQTSNVITTTTVNSVVTPSEDETKLIQDADTLMKEISDSPTNLDSESSPSVTTVENETNTGGTASGSRPPSADRPNSKSPELEQPENDAQETSETPKEDESQSESKRIDDSPIAKKPGILELVTDETTLEEPHASMSEKDPEKAPNLDTSVKAPSPSESKESNGDEQESLNPTDASPPIDDITSVTSDEHTGAENPHKDGYDASVSGNEEESNDQPAYTPTAIEKSMKEDSEPRELSVPDDTAEVTDVPATSSETLVPSPSPTPESMRGRPRSPKSVKFSDEGKVPDDQGISNDDAKRWEDLRHSSQTPLPVIIKQTDLLLIDDEEPTMTSSEDVEDVAAVVVDSPIPSPEPMVLTTLTASSPTVSEEKENEITPEEGNREEELQLQIQKLETKISDLEEDKSRLLQEKNSQISKANDAHEKANKELQSEIQELKKNIQDQNNSHKNEIDSYKTDIEKQQKEFQEYKISDQKKRSVMCVIL